MPLCVDISWWIPLKILRYSKNTFYSSVNIVRHYIQLNMCGCIKCGRGQMKSKEEVQPQAQGRDISLVHDLGVFVWITQTNFILLSVLYYILLHTVQTKYNTFIFLNLKTLQYSGWLMVYFWPFYRSELFMLRRLRSLAECGVGIWPTCSPQRQPARDLPVLSADSVSQGPPIQKAI